MLIATPEGWASRSFRIERDDGSRVASLDVSLLREGGRLELNGRSLRVARKHMLSGPWVLLDGDRVLFEASKPAALRNRFLVTVTGASLELSPRSWTLRSFRVVGPEWADLGTLRRASWFSRRVEIELSELIPLEAQLFFFVLALILWRRADGATS